MDSLKRILNRRSFGVMLAVSSGVLFLSACAVPPSVQIASWVADGISYIATQKSLTDHGISLLAQRDCALWRGIKGEAICRNPDSGTFAVASGDGEKTPDIQRGEKTPDIQRGEKTPDIKRGEKTADGIFAVPIRAAPWFKAVTALTAVGTVGAGGRERGRARKALPAERVAQSGLFYVIGSFTRFNFAQALVQRYGALNAYLVDASVGGSRLYRVVVGPFGQDRQYSVYRRIAEAGIDDAWATLMTLPAVRRTARMPLSGGLPVKSPAPETAEIVIPKTTAKILSPVRS